MQLKRCKENDSTFFSFYPAQQQCLLEMFSRLCRQDIQQYILCSHTYGLVKLHKALLRMMIWMQKINLHKPGLQSFAWQQYVKTSPFLEQGQLRSSQIPEVILSQNELLLVMPIDPFKCYAYQSIMVSRIDLWIPRFSPTMQLVHLPCPTPPNLPKKTSLKSPTCTSSTSQHKFIT